MLQFVIVATIWLCFAEGQDEAHEIKELLGFVS
jgi:hypothetical protein